MGTHISTNYFTLKRSRISNIATSNFKAKNMKVVSVGLPLLILFVFPFAKTEKAPKWSCSPGQGQYGKFINEIPSVDIDTCEEKCIEFDGCIGVDYTSMDDSKLSSSCRMYKSNIVRSEAGVHNRTYCTMQHRDLKCQTIVGIGREKILKKMLLHIWFLLAPSASKISTRIY